MLGGAPTPSVFPEFAVAQFIAPNVTVDDANMRVEPFVSFATNATGGAVLYTTSAYGSFMEWWKELSQSGALGPRVGGNIEIASRLLPRELAKERPEEVARIALSLGVTIKYVYPPLFEHMSNTCRILIRFCFFFFNKKSFVAGGAVSRVDPESTGLNPSWRKAVAQVSIGESWEEGADSAMIFAARERLKRGTDVLDKLTKDSGSYLNEVRTISNHTCQVSNNTKRCTTSGFTLRTRLQEIVLWISLSQVEKDQREI